MKVIKWRLVGITEVWQNINKIKSAHEIQLKIACFQEEQGKAEAERNKLEQTLKILEGKVKTHQDNIKGMRENLTCKENEKQVPTSNHMLCIFI